MIHFQDASRVSLVPDEWLIRVANEVLGLTILLSEIYVSIVEKQPPGKVFAIT